MRVQNGVENGVQKRGSKMGCKNEVQKWSGNAYAQKTLFCFTFCKTKYIFFEFGERESAAFILIGRGGRWTAPSVLRKSCVPRAI